MATPPDSSIRVIGERRTPFGDFYHYYLRRPWWAALGMIVAVYLALNVMFALAYRYVGGVAHARPASFADAFYFSVQTMGTIGYGAMYPTSAAANVIVVVESVTGLIVTALATGLVFAKFSRSTGRVVFTRQAVISLMDGVPTLMFRVGNERGNTIMEAQLRVVVVRTEHTAEGSTFYRMHDVGLSRDRSPAFSRSWTALHPITPSSPFFGATPESVKAMDSELVVTLVGVDDTSFQPLHARKAYDCDDILWGARHADILSEDDDGRITLDLRKFHDVVPTEPTPEFPYSARRT